MGQSWVRFNFTRNEEESSLTWVKTNGYDECTLNKMIKGYQCTIQVYVDDLKLSYLYQDELDKITDAEIFGSNGNLLTASYGKVHEYL